MAGRQFDNSDDPVFDVRVADVSQAATVQQQAADALDGGTTRASIPSGEPGGDDPSPIEQIAADVGAAAEDALLAAMAAAAAAAPPVAAATAIIDQAENLLDAGNEAAKAIGGALDDIFGGGDEHSGESTFDTPVGPPQTQEEKDAMAEATLAEARARAAAQQAEIDTRERIDGAKNQTIRETAEDRATLVTDEHHQFVGDLDDETAAGAEKIVSDEHHQFVGDLQGDVAAGATDRDVSVDGVLQPVDELRPDVSIGAASGGGAVDGAPDGVYEPVTESGLHTRLGGGPSFDDGIAGPGATGGSEDGAPDGVMETVDGLSPEVAIGANPAIDVDHLSTADHPPAVGDLGADVSLNPQPIPPGIGADIGDLGLAPDGALGPVGSAPDHIDIGSGPDIGVIAGTATHLLGDGGASDSAPLSGAPDGVVGNVVDARPEVAIGADIDVGPGPRISAVAAHDVAPGEDIGLNPQPIPPGIGADIGEPVANTAVDHAPSIADAAIIIVGGTEAPLLAGDSHDGIDAGGADQDTMLTPDGALVTVTHLSPDVAIGAGVNVASPSGGSSGQGGGGTAGSVREGGDAPGGDVSLNPQPIPPGVGADIGEPVADATADHAPSVHDSAIIFQTEAPLLAGDADSGIAGAQTLMGADIPTGDASVDPITATADSAPMLGAEVGSTVPSGDSSSIIIVGGAEALMFVEDAADDDLAVQDVASAIADGGDGPSFSVGMVDDQPVDVGITENEFDT